MKIPFVLFNILLLLIGLLIFQLFSYLNYPAVLSASTSPEYWLMLHRKSSIEYLYFGIPGQITKSQLVKTFKVKSGIPGERPTPLPNLVNKEYWLITSKESSDNLEVAPYFLTLNIPGIENESFGPEPYLECNGQCNWILPGAFGLHGINGDTQKLADENIGSSGCIRHSDEDITYLYQLLSPKEKEIRYYIKDV